jgi:hypothetical protein
MRTVVVAAASRPVIGPVVTEPATPPLATVIPSWTCSGRLVVPAGSLAVTGESTAATTTRATCALVVAAVERRPVAGAALEASTATLGPVVTRTTTTVVRAEPTPALRRTVFAVITAV